MIKRKSEVVKYIVSHFVYVGATFEFLPRFYPFVVERVTHFPRLWRPPLQRQDQSCLVLNMYLKARGCKFELSSSKNKWFSSTNTNWPQMSAYKWASDTTTDVMK